MTGLFALFRNTALASLIGIFASIASAQAENNASPNYALSMHGDVALPADFTHFPYANPDAPKGGALKMGVVGTFDSLNPFVLKSMRTTARGLFGDLDFGNLLYETLMQRSRDEPFTLYGLLAEKLPSIQNANGWNLRLTRRPNGPTVSLSPWTMSSSPMTF